jgi:signal transduction histidine kinase
VTSVERSTVVEQGELSFTIESRLLRELGERLVKQPEVALVELVKNSYDADASECEIQYIFGESVSVIDDGNGMTLEQFRNGWMRIGTSAKVKTPTSQKYHRRITGEKGIGRFAVRFLGRALHLESVAYDAERGHLTRLRADFDWPSFDKYEDLGMVRVPYTLSRIDDDNGTGTTLAISLLRTQVEELRLQRVRTESIGILSPLRPLFHRQGIPGGRTARATSHDPGFSLLIQDGGDADEGDVAASILDAYVLRATIKLEGTRLELNVFRRGEPFVPYMSIVDSYTNDIAPVEADIRFFPRRKGVFAGTPIDGRRAYSWVTSNSGVTVFDRDFRVQPYGSPYDDWLLLARDAARNYREPRSSIAQAHFPMTAEVRADTASNWMLRLPQSTQLVGVVQVQGRRVGSRRDDDAGLTASADREGFVENKAFLQLQNLVRGAIEAIAQADRRLQQEEAEAERQKRLEEIRKETQDAVDQIRNSSTISPSEKNRILDTLTQTQHLFERHEERARERERQLEVMSLLGVVAGFMTHEFGTALQDLKDAQAEIHVLAGTIPELAAAEKSLAQHTKNLTDFVTYAQGYVAGSSATPDEPYKVRPRLRQVVRVFGQYASARHIEIEINADTDLLAPLVPVSLYNGIALNLYTNALKAVTARSGPGPRVIAFRAWNDHQWHFLEVSDTGIGIPAALHDRVFDALFTTTSSRRDPLGSGMGLGLALVRQGVTAFGGKVEVVDPPPEFVTCVRVRLPLAGDGAR